MRNRLLQTGTFLVAQHSARALNHHGGIPFFESSGFDGPNSVEGPSHLVSKGLALRLNVKGVLHLLGYEREGVVFKEAFDFEGDGCRRGDACPGPEPFDLLLMEC